MQIKRNRACEPRLNLDITASIPTGYKISAPSRPKFENMKGSNDEMNES